MGSAGYAANCLRDVMGKGKHANLQGPLHAIKSTVRRRIRAALFITAEATKDDCGWYD